MTINSPILKLLSVIMLAAHFALLTACKKNDRSGEKVLVRSQVNLKIPIEDPKLDDMFPGFAEIRRGYGSRRAYLHDFEVKGKHLMLHIAYENKLTGDVCDKFRSSELADSLLCELERGVWVERRNIIYSGRGTWVSLETALDVAGNWGSTE